MQGIVIKTHKEHAFLCGIGFHQSPFSRANGFFIRPNYSLKVFGLFPITDRQETQHVFKYTVWVFENVSVAHWFQLRCVMLLKRLRLLFIQFLKVCDAHESKWKPLDENFIMKHLIISMKCFIIEFSCRGLRLDSCPLETYCSLVCQTVLFYLQVNRRRASFVNSAELIPWGIRLKLSKSYKYLSFYATAKIFSLKTLS